MSTVLDNVFFADGSVNSLGIALLPDYSGTAQVLPNKKIQVQIGNKSQIIPFSVSHPDDDTIRSLRIHPRAGIRRRAAADQPEGSGAEGQERAAAADRPRTSTWSLWAEPQVHITDSASVKATHANGASLVVDDHTLLYTSAARYFGPASITFEVTDGRTANDPNGHVAILTLAIDVQPRDNQPPAFIGGVVDFEQGQQKELDLVRLTNYPYPDVNELAYTVLPPDPVGFTLPARRPATAGHRERECDDRQHHRDRDRGQGRRERRPGRQDPASGGSLDPAPGQAHPGYRGRQARSDHHGRRAEQRPGQQPLPRHAPEGDRHPRNRRQLAPGRRHDHPEQRQVARSP